MGMRMILVFAWIALVFTALAVIWSVHDSRQLLGSYQDLKGQYNLMLVNNNQFLLQLKALTASGYVESLAAEEMKLKYPAVSEMVQVEI